MAKICDKQQQIHHINYYQKQTTCDFQLDPIQLQTESRLHLMADCEWSQIW